MIFTGNNFRLTPEVNQMGFALSGITITGTGNCEFGFSGQGNYLRFRFSNKKIYSPEDRHVGSFNLGEPVSIYGSFDESLLQYSINNTLTESRRPKTDFNVQRFIVNTTGAVFSSDIKLYSINFPTTLSVDSNFQALTALSGRLVNGASVGFRVFSGLLSFIQSSEDLLTGVISGGVSGQSTFGFSLTDLNTSRFDSQVNLNLQLDTSIGAINGSFLVNRVSGLDLVVNKLATDSTGSTMAVLFDGSGKIPNQFIYVPTPQSQYFSYYCSSSNLRGEAQPKLLNVSLTSVSPTGSGYRSDYITGFTLTSSGQYMSIPTAAFTGYYYVSDLTTSLTSILLSSGCSGNIPVVFSGVLRNLANASGILTTKKIILSNVYDVGVNNYYVPSSFTMISGGTGYLTTPKALLQTGIYSNCYDTAGKYGFNLYSYAPFNGSGVILPSASYLTGEVLYRTGLVSGGLLTGYIVTGIEITNVGSGYNQSLFPKMSFVRRSGDSLTSDASGVFTLKQSGQYLFTGHWGIKTGVSTANLITVTGNSGLAILRTTQNYFFVQINYSGLDNTEPIVSNLSVSMVSGDSTSFNISGVKRYDTTTGFLKKKYNMNLSLFTPGSELSFLLSQSDLDTYYNSSFFINNGDEIDLGDLDF
jgi:hypothetical protein